MPTRAAIGSWMRPANPRSESSNSDEAPSSSRRYPSRRSARQPPLKPASSSMKAKACQRRNSNTIISDHQLSLGNRLRSFLITSTIQPPPRVERLMVRLWVANTDPDWFDFLASQSWIDEVNFLH